MNIRRALQGKVAYYRYCWENDGPPLPGQLEPLQTPFGNVSVVFASEPEERERCIILRKLRTLMGYGRAGTFRKALIDKVFYSRPFLFLVWLACVIILAIAREMLCAAMR